MFRCVGRVVLGSKGNSFIFDSEFPRHKGEDNELVHYAYITIGTVSYEVKSVAFFKDQDGGLVDGKPTWVKGAIITVGKDGIFKEGDKVYVEDPDPIPDLAPPPIIPPTIEETARALAKAIASDELGVKKMKVTIPEK